MNEIELDRDLAELLHSVVERRRMVEEDVVRICEALGGGGMINVYPSETRSTCARTALFIADMKLERNRLTFDQAFDVLIDHVCGRCPEVREVAFIAFDEFIQKKYSRFAATLERLRAERRIEVRFYQWSQGRLLKLPH